MIVWGDLHVQEEWFTKLSSEHLVKEEEIFIFVLFFSLIYRKSYAGDYS